MLNRCTVKSCTGGSNPPPSPPVLYFQSHRSRVTVAATENQISPETRVLAFGRNHGEPQSYPHASYPTADGKRPFVNPVYAANGRLRPLYALVAGKAEHHPEGAYHLRYAENDKRIWESVGRDPNAAIAAKLVSTYSKPRRWVW